MKITVKKRRRNFNKTTDILKQNNMERLLKYLKENPHEAKRFNQCFNCLKLKSCKKDCEEDENGMCKECGPIGN